MKDIISTAAAPSAIGPYSQATAAGGFIFTSGQLGMDPETGVLAEGVQAQTRRSLENVKAILSAAGVGMGQVLKTTVFLQNMSDFAAMNEVYAEFFPEGQYPARSAVEVAALPKGGLVEIEAVAAR